MIIGICGKKFSGKGEVAKYLSMKFDIPIYSFATPLKKLVTEMSGLTDDDKSNEKLYTGRRINIKPLTFMLKNNSYERLTSNEVDHIRATEYYKCNEIYRMLQQYIGTNIVRGRNLNHWVHQFGNDHKNQTSFIVDDIRFKNEIGFLKNYANFELYKVKRNIDFAYDSHESETELDGYRIKNSNIIVNDYEELSYLHSILDSKFDITK